MTDPIPFRSSDEAWFWFCLMQAERLLGHKSSGVGPGRPCDIDDIALAYRRILRSGKIQHRHEAVMVHYGRRQVVPDRRVDPRGLQAWGEAMDYLHTELAAKGIVEVHRSAKQQC